jgi:hypothetical protein
VANITRIKNNQITDSTITYTKLASGTLVGSVFNPDLTLSSNVTILGNLSVSGNSSTINSVNTYINDPTVVFNNGYVGSLSGYDIGFIVNRNWASLSNYGAVNTAFVWNENQQAFLAITSTTSGNNIVSLTNSGFANTKVGNLTSNSVTVTTGTIVATAGGVQNTPIGSVTASTGAFTTLSASGVSTLNANVVIAGGSDTVSTTTGALVITGSGGASIAGNTYVGNNLYIGATALTQHGNFANPTIIAVDSGSNYAQIALKNTNGNGSADFAAYTDNGSDAGGWVDVGIAGSTYNDANYTITKPQDGSLITRPTGNTYGGNLVIGTSEAGSYNDIVIGVGSFAASAEVARFHGNATTSGYLVLAQGTAATSSATGALRVTGGVGVTGAIYAAGVNATTGNVTTLVAPNFNSSNAQVTGTSSYFGTGASLASSIYGTTGFLTNFSSGNTQITGTSSYFGTGASLASSIYGTTGYFTNLSASNLLIGTSTVTNLTVTNFSTGNAVISGGYISAVANIGATYGTFTNLASGNAVITGGSTTGMTNGSYTTLQATNFSSGNARITGGYADNFPIGANTRATGAFTALATNGIVTHTGSTESTSTTSGQMQVTGGVGITGNLWVGGNLYVANIFSTTTQTVTIQDPLVYLQALGNLSNYNYDIGFFSDYTAPYYAHTGLARSVASNTWVFFSNVQSEPAGTINWNDAGLIYDTVKAGAVILANTQQASSTTTGVLQVGGGAGIVGNVYAGNINTTGTATLTTVQATNIFGTAGTITGLTNLTATTAQATNFSTGNAQITGTGSYVGTGASLVNSVYGTTGYLTNFSTGNAQVTGTGSYVGTGASLVNSVYATTGYMTNLFSSNITGNFNQASLNGTVPTANVSLYDTVAATTTNATFYPSIVDKATGNVTNYTQSAFTINPSTGTVSATQFSGTSNFTTAVATNFSSSNIAVSGGYISALTNATVTTATVTSATITNLNTSNIVVTSGYLRGLANVQAVNGTFSGVTTVGGNLVANSQTNSTSTTTGALQVTGGAGVMANVFIGGSTTLGSNRAAGYDTITQGLNDASLIWARSGAAYDQVLIGNSATASTLVRGAKLQINSTDSILLPVGTNAQRPSSSGGTDAAGMFRYSTTVSGPEYYNGTSWQSLTSSFTVITDEQFAGDGTTVNFTMAGTTTTAATIVSINGVMQIPTLAYSVSGTTLTFTEAPTSGDVIDVRRLTTTATVTQISSTNGYMQFVVDNNGAYVYTGASSTTATTYWEPSGAKVGAVANVSVASANTLTNVDSFSATTYRSAKYVVQATQGTNYQVSEVLVLHDGTTATRAMFGVINTSANVGVTAATLSGGTVYLQYVAASAGTTVRITKDYVLI